MQKSRLAHCASFISAHNEELRKVVPARYNPFTLKNTGLFPFSLAMH
jgi:hypothetical protein